MRNPSRTARELLTVDEIREDLGDEKGPLPRRTWQQWKHDGTGPACIRLPNGKIRVRRDEYERWLASREMPSPGISPAVGSAEGTAA